MNPTERAAGVCLVHSVDLPCQECDGEGPTTTGDASVDEGVKQLETAMLRCAPDHPAEIYLAEGYRLWLWSVAMDVTAHARRIANNLIFRTDQLTWSDEDEYCAWLNRLMEHAPEEFDGDVAMEDLVSQYIKALEHTVRLLLSGDVTLFSTGANPGIGFEHHFLDVDAEKVALVAAMIRPWRETLA